jgi:hypothetical protein
VIRCCAAEGHCFQDGGVFVGRHWTAVALDERGRAFLLAHTPRFARVHPDDRGELVAAGLDLVDGRVVEAPTAPEPPAPAAEVPPPAEEPPAAEVPPPAPQIDRPRKNKR